MNSLLFYIYFIVIWSLDSYFFKVYISISYIYVLFHVFILLYSVCLSVEIYYLYYMFLSSLYYSYSYISLTIRTHSLSVYNIFIRLSRPMHYHSSYGSSSLYGIFSWDLFVFQDPLDEWYLRIQPALEASCQPSDFQLSDTYQIRPQSDMLFC